MFMECDPNDPGKRCLQIDLKVIFDEDETFVTSTLRFRRNDSYNFRDPSAPPSIVLDGDASFLTLSQVVANGRVLSEQDYKVCLSH